MQKGDFLHILSIKFSPMHDGLHEAMEAMKVQSNRPPSIFQCQMKLFDEWFDLWSEAERGALIEKLREIDEAFIAKFEDEMNGPPPVVNDNEAAMPIPEVV